MSKWIDHQSDSSWSHDLLFRHSVKGPEADLVAQFRNHVSIDPPSGYRVTSFIEPRLESGFPDLVIAVWKTSALKHWVDARFEVSTNDLRILQYLCEVHDDSERHLATVFGGEVEDSLERLEDARLIRCDGVEWIPLSMQRTFAIGKLIAVEAKTGQWQSAIQQAQRNWWFAHSSCILSPQNPKHRRVRESLERAGIEFWTAEPRTIKFKVRSRDRVPRSYASWLFNEWILREFISDHMGTGACLNCD